MRSEFEEKQAELKAQFEAKIDEIKRKSAEELNNTKAEMIARLKRDYGKKFLASYTVKIEKKLFNLLYFRKCRIELREIQGRQRRRATRHTTKLQAKTF